MRAPFVGAFGKPPRHIDRRAARYQRVDQAIGEIRRNGAKSVGFPAIHQYRDSI